MLTTVLRASPIVRPFLAALAIVALLVAFHQVVRAGMHQGELRRQAVTTHVEAVWRCGYLRTPRLREDCLLRLRAASQPAAVPAPVALVASGP